MLDIIYTKLELRCFELMGEYKIPASQMSYVVNRLLANIYTMHINELNDLDKPIEMDNEVLDEERCE